MHFVLSGQGIPEIQGAAYPVRENQIFVVPSGEISTCRASRSRPWEYCWIGFLGTQPGQFLRALVQKAASPFVPDCQNAAYYEERIAGVLYMENGGIGKHLRSNGMLYDVRGTLLDEIRKDEQARLKAEGREEEAQRLKHSKYLLCSDRTTLQKRDQQAADGVLKHKGPELFDVPGQKRRGGREERCEELINNNLLFFVADYVKTALAAAYECTDRAKMEQEIKEIVEVCRLTENKHFEWFANLLEGHLDGITSHADYPNSSGKAEGMNNKIKTIRRKSYGLTGSTYFFLKIMDASRRKTA